jgi:hypothetical protein
MKTFKIILLFLVAAMLVSPVLMIFASLRELPVHQTVSLEKPAVTAPTLEVPAGDALPDDFQDLEMQWGTQSGSDEDGQ